MTSFISPQNANLFFCGQKDLDAQTILHNRLLITLMLLTASNVPFPQLLYTHHKLTAADGLFPYVVNQILLRANSIKTHH